MYIYNVTCSIVKIPTDIMKNASLPLTIHVTKGLCI